MLADDHTGNLEPSLYHVIIVSSMKSTSDEWCGLSISHMDGWHHNVVLRGNIRLRTADVRHDHNSVTFVTTENIVRSNEWPGLA